MKFFDKVKKCDIFVNFQTLWSEGMHNAKNITVHYSLHKHDHDPFWQDSRLVIHFKKYTYLSTQNTFRKVCLSQKKEAFHPRFVIAWWHPELQFCSSRNESWKSSPSKILLLEKLLQSWKKHWKQKKDFSWSCKKERCYFRTSTSGSANSVEVVALASMAKVEAAL